MKKLVTLFCIMFFAGLANAAMFDENKEGRIMVNGIRPMGMGGAFTAVSDDENAIFYNPAGISARQYFLLQILSIDLTLNAQTLKAATDIMKTLEDEQDASGGGDSGFGADGLEEIVGHISGKDIEASISLPNIFFISGPFGQNNTFNFGLGEYSYVDIGLIVDLKIPKFVFDLARKSEAGGLSDGEVFNIIPLEKFQGSLAEGVTFNDFQLAIAEAKATGDPDVWALVKYMLNDETRKLIENMESGDADISQIISDISKAMNLGDDLKAMTVIDTYATGIVAMPMSYKIADLSKITDKIYIPGQLSIGANIKYIQRVKFRKYVSLSGQDIGALSDDIDSVSLNGAAVHGTGAGFDLGFIYHYTPEWNFGLQISDIYTVINYDNVLAKFPDTAPDSDFTHTARIFPEFNIGAAYVPEKIYYWRDRYFETNNRFTFAFDMRDLTSEYEPAFINKLHLGIEWRYGFLALRAGINKKYPTVGLGIEFSPFQLSYAYYGDESHLTKALYGESEGVYYHKLLIALKLGHHDGKPFGNDAKRIAKAREAANPTSAEPESTESTSNDAAGIAADNAGPESVATPDSSDNNDAAPNISGQIAAEQEHLDENNIFDNSSIGE
jgi:hypothetical protein